MIVIADSGATKTDWCLVTRNGCPNYFITGGLNPYHVNEHAFPAELIRHFPSDFSRLDVGHVFFYGAGCAATEKALIAEKGLREFFPNAAISVFSDILAAARALFGDGQGIVAILGTGTNIGFYNEGSLMHYTPSLGYILGDEGSGAFLGKEFLRMWFYNELPPEIAQAFHEWSGQTLSNVLHSVYSMPLPARFLAETVPFIHMHREHPVVRNFLIDSFRLFAAKHLAKIPHFSRYEIGVAGSIGLLFENDLKQAIQSIGGKLTRTVQYPIQSIAEYHTSRIYSKS